MIRVSHAFLVTLFAFTLVHYAIAEEITIDKRADIEKLLEVSGSLDLGIQFADAIVKQMSNSIKSAKPDVPDRFFDILHKEIIEVFQDNIKSKGGMLDRVIPIYSKYYTHKEIKELLAFYQSDIGKKTIKVQPMLMQESMIAGQQWGRSLGPLINKKIEKTLKEEGIELPE